MSTAKKSKTTTFSRVFHPPKKSIIFSGNQSWIFWQKMKIWNSVKGYARNPPDKSLEGIFCTAKKGGKSELSSYAFLLLLLRQTKGTKKLQCTVCRHQHYTLFEIFIFCPKIQLWFLEKIVKKLLGEKLVKMLGFFYQNWIFGQKFDFLNSVSIVANKEKGKVFVLYFL